MDTNREIAGKGAPGGLIRSGYYFVSFLYVELVFAVSTGTLGAGFWKTAILCLCGAAILTLLVRALPGRGATALVTALMVIVPLLAAAQMIYYRIFSTFFTIFSASNGGQVLEFFWFVVEVVAKNFGYLLLFSLPALGHIFFLKRKFPFPARPPRRAPVRILAACLLYALQLILFLPCARDPYSPLGRAMGQGDAKTSVSELGLFATMQIDIYSHLYSGAETAALAAAPEEVPLSDAPSPPVSPVPQDTPPASEEPQREAGLNALAIDFDALLEESADDPALSQLHSYFASLTPDARNEYTGLFEGYNLIYMTCEGFSHLAIDEELTPTLYKMQREGIYFTDSYNPPWGVSTTDGEYVACTGLVPKQGVWSMYQSADNYLPFVMGNQLRRLGYEAKAYHNHLYEYYRRDLSHPNMGYSYIGRGHGMDVEKTWPESDLEMMQKSIDGYISQEPFHAYYMTVSGHLQYNFRANYQSAKHRDKVEHLPYSENVKAYLACQLELEYAMAHLTERLEEAGIAERTLIVLVADHYPYGLTPGEISELEGHKVDEDFEMFKNAMIIHAKGMEPITVTDPVSSTDLLPTVSNLMGLPYDSRLLSGRDVFSGSPPLVMFTNRSFITEKGRYNGKTGRFYPNEGVEAGSGYVEETLAGIEAKFAAARKILELDYYDKIRRYLPQANGPDGS